jgi:copper(I)-binding protein
LTINPGQTVDLNPGSIHVMFVGLTKPLVAGEHVKASLTFEKAGTLDIEYDVLAMGAKPGNNKPNMKMPMPGMNMPGH